MNKQKAKWSRRAIRHLRVRKKVSGTAERPRLSVYRSLNNISAQLIDDTKGQTILAVSSLTPEIKKELKTGGNLAAAQAVGKQLGELALKKGIKAVVFDKGYFPYHGRIKALAETTRKAGLKF